MATAGQDGGPYPALASASHPGGFPGAPHSEPATPRHPLCSVTLVMSKSVGPRRLKPPRLLCPWHSPGRNSGGGCHALFQGGLPNPGIEPLSLSLPQWQAGSLPLAPPRAGEPKQATFWKRQNYGDSNKSVATRSLGVGEMK